MALGAAVVSGHNNYWLWGPTERQVQTVISVNLDEEDLRATFEQVELFDRIECGDCMPYENHAKVLIARGPRLSIQEIWPTLKHFD